MFGFVRREIFQEHRVEGCGDAVPRNIAQKKEECFVRIARKAENVAANRGHRFPKVCELNAGDYRYATGDHDFLNVAGALQILTEDFILFAQALLVLH